MIDNPKYLIKKHQAIAADIVALSYPKSGRTWLRYFLARYYENAKNQPFDIEFLTTKPRIHFTHNFMNYHQHDEQTPEMIDVDDYLNKKIILLIRDPRDVVVSFYHHLISREKKIKNVSLENFIFSDTYGIERQCNFVLKEISFYEKHKGDKLFIKYEDFLNNDYEFNKLINFIFGEIDEQNLSKSIEQSRFESMRKYELGKNSDGRIGTKNWNGDINALKTRKGKLGSYKEELSEKIIQKINLLANTKFILEKYYG